MTTLHATAVISAVDRASAVFARVGAAAKSVAGRYGAAAAAASKFNSAVGVGGAVGGAAGFMAIIQRTQEFEKKALGVRIAGIADAFDRLDARDPMRVNHGIIAKDADKLRSASLEVSKALGVSPTGVIEAAEAFAKMGVSLEKAQAGMRSAAILTMADPEIKGGSAAEFLGTLGILFKAPDDAAGYDKFIAATADKLQTTASATRTSVSKLQEGFRQFAPVFASFGATIDQTSALIGTMSNKGLMDTESGTALKSASLRFIRPTVEGSAALAAAGIDRRKYMDLSAADPRRATNQLVQLYPGQIDKKEKQTLYQMLVEGQRQGKGADPDYIAKVVAYVNKATKASTQADRDENYLKVLNAITTSGGQVKIFEFLRDIADKVAKGEMNYAQLGTIFEGRHIARMLALFSDPAMIDRLMTIIGRADGSGLDAVEKEYKGSSFGKYESAIAALDRGLIRIRESEAFSALLNNFEKLANYIAALPAGVVDFATKFMVALAGIGAASLIVKGLSAAFGLLAAAFALIVANPITATLVAIGAAAVTIWQNFDKVKESVLAAIEALKGFSLGDALRKTDGVAYESFANSRSGNGAVIPRTGDARQQVDVQGEANIKSEIEVTIKGLPAGIGSEVTRWGGGDGKVRLNTGRSMPDTGAFYP
jgi:TP901 family phage tail tape measure protein